MVAAAAAHPRPVPLASRLTADEAEAHAAFIASMGEKALWLKYADAPEAEKTGS